MYKVIYIDHNFIDTRYPNNINNGNAFYTYGWGSILARKYKKYYCELEIECWKADSRINKEYEKTVDNVKYRMFPSIKVGKLGHFSYSLLKQIEKETNNKNKVVFNISSIRHLLFYTVALKLKNYPLVVQHHGESTAIHKASINKAFKKLYYALQKPIEKKALKNVDIFFVLDLRIKEYLPNGNNKLKVELSTTGVDDDIFKAINKTEAKRSLGWDENKKHVLYVGRLSYTKRSDILLDLYQEIKEEGYENIELILAGTEKSDVLYERAQKEGIKIYPLILQTELYKYLSAADVYCLPNYSRGHAFAGIGLLPVQSLLCETPVVGGSLATFPKEDINKIGIYADDKESIKKALLKICNGDVNFTGLREIAIKHYGWENISKRTKEHYDNLIFTYYDK